MGHLTLNDGRLCIGLISGTSADAIDAALVRIDGAGADATIELVAFEAIPYPADVRQEALALCDPNAEQAIPRLCSLNVVIGERFADAALAVCRAAEVSPEQVHVIGSHGQTVWHQPEVDAALPLSTPSTLQIGEPAVIAERTGVTVVADFRAADMAAGGQGAPLVPYYDWVTLRHPSRNRAVQNIGGIGNVTFLPAGGSVEEVRAFDTGPGNMVIDGLVTLLTAGSESYDRDGKFAATGSVDDDLLASLLQDSYLLAPPPKTTGRERYGLPFARAMIRAAGLAEGALRPDSSPDSPTLQKARSLIATATALTARSIAESYRRWLPGFDEAIVSGGGSRNPTLMGMLRAELAPAAVTTLDEHGVNSRAKEAMAFALMAHDALEGLPTNVPGATGARRAVPLGVVTLSARKPLL